jgi:hypothetical protein
MDQRYPIIDGVVMKPGARVYIDDRDSPAYDDEGVIKEVKGDRIKVSFEGAGKHWFDQYYVNPTREECESESARAWRAARALKVFLCHGSEDKASVRELYQRLLDADMRPWLDEVDIAPGVDWDASVRDAVRDCHVVLVCLSHKSVDKVGYVQKEIKFALDRADEMPEDNKYIFPVKLEECDVPRRLSKWQWVNLYDTDGYQRLLDSLKSYASELRLDYS